jgi:hypothetical protein
MKREQDREVIDVPYEVVEVNGECLAVSVEPLSEPGGKQLLPTPRRDVKNQLARVPAMSNLPVWEDGI